MALSKKDVAKNYGTFVKQYGVQSRKNHKNMNDRGYDRKLEAEIKRLSPEELMELTADDDGQP
ncbi:MAG: hypothetical protein NC180_12340 [Muribaculaceae bacterium]|nr:hypothetical protein [Roseburia sp.]MCM1432270.1 hypothetical protein [Muribaculaceae bacterium]MCM1493991.1 hypothetical protein [Muribaculaceae bacterium]MCM1561052.1 hypothetical protein [Butyrivibrio sp.]